jgi:transcriptional regulator with XRE-family HTH domain
MVEKQKEGGEQMQFHERVRKHLKDNGISQRWLANKTGLNPQTLWRWVQGQRKMPVEAAIKISKALNLPIIEEEDN